MTQVTNREKHIKYEDFTLFLKLSFFPIVKQSKVIIPLALAFQTYTDLQVNQKAMLPHYVLMFAPPSVKVSITQGLSVVFQ